MVNPPRERPNAWNCIPPFSPAAQRCTRIVVLSIICNPSSSPPPQAGPCNRTSHTADSHQRRNCRQIEFQLPNASGRSRQGVPVRQIQRIPSNTRRWLTGGRPPRNEAVARKRSTIAHSSSVIKPRITANLQGERSASNHTARREGNSPQKKTRCESRLGRVDSLNCPEGSDFFVTRLCRLRWGVGRRRVGWGFVPQAYNGGRLDLDKIIVRRALRGLVTGPPTRCDAEARWATPV